jgi:hypothetical protein
LSLNRCHECLSKASDPPCRFETTGACTVPLEVKAGDRVLADFGELGAVSVSFSE